MFELNQKFKIHFSFAHNHTMDGRFFDII